MENNINLETLLQKFEASVDATRTSREMAERDRDYYDNKQWTEEEANKVKSRGQAPIVVNQIAPKIDFLLGTERQQRTDPKAYPRTPVHADAAHAASDAIKYVVDNNNFDQIASDAFEELAIEGIQGGIVEAKKTNKGIEITVKRQRWDRTFFDPYSRMRDFSDANYLGSVIWLDFAEAKQMFNIDDATFDSMLEHGDDTYDDKPNTKWFDSSRKRIRVVEMYFRQGGKWHHAIFTKGAYLVKPELSRYIDEDGEPECPIILSSAKLDRAGNRYGAVRQYIGPQDEINKRRSKFLHLLSVRQVLMGPNSVDNPDTVSKELAKPDGKIKLLDPNARFEILPTGDMSQGQFLLYQEAKKELDDVGVNPALTGNGSGSASGRALENRQQSGLMELGPFFDAHRMWKKRIYRAIWNRVKQFWNDEKWIRVTDDENNLQWVGLNAPVTQADQVVMEDTGLKLGEVKQKFSGDIQQAIQSNPALGQQVGTENQVAELDVDIIIEDAPNTVNLQSEEFDKLVQMYQANPNGVPWELIVEMSSLRNKNDLLERYKGNEEQAAAQAQEQEQMKQLAITKEKAELEKTIAEADKAGAEADQRNIENEILINTPVVPSVNI